MKRKALTVKSKSLLCLLHGHRILQPHSLQPRLQLVIPFEEYVNFMSGQCGSNLIISDTLFTLESYKEAINKYENGITSYIKVYYTLDCLRAGVLELKKALARKRYATIIVLRYDNVEEIELNSMFGKLQTLWEESPIYKDAFNKAMEQINTIGDSTPIVLRDITEDQNREYFSYLVYMYTVYYATKDGAKFCPINIK